VVDWEQHDAFLRAAQETPADDAPRLIYADWLEEGGEAPWAAYAEFIRIQVETANLKNRSKHRRARLAARQGELLAAHSHVWLGRWAAVPFRWVYRRGVPERLRARAQGAWIGRRLGSDWGFRDRVEFDEQGRVRVSYGDVNWAGLWPPVEGSYQLHFTFAQVRAAVELWQVEGRTLRYEGRFTPGGELLELEEQGGTSRQKPERVQLTLAAPYG
jgi:uncharacterized protein (TIGR02996 family)